MSDLFKQFRLDHTYVTPIQRPRGGKIGVFEKQYSNKLEKLNIQEKGQIMEIGTSWDLHKQAGIHEGQVKVVLRQLTKRFGPLNRS